MRIRWHPPLVIRLEGRSDYFDSIEKYQLKDDASDYKELMLSRLDASLDDYFSFLKPGDDPAKKFGGPDGP